jgi:hypothetical protein
MSRSRNSARRLRSAFAGRTLRIGGIAAQVAEPAVKKEAEQECRAAIKENPQDEKAICALAEIAETSGDTQQA